MVVSIDCCVAGVLLFLTSHASASVLAVYCRQLHTASSKAVRRGSYRYCNDIPKGCHVLLTHPATCLLVSSCSGTNDEVEEVVTNACPISTAVAVERCSVLALDVGS